jgi:hypothetical protein
MDIHTAEPLLPEHSLVEVEIAIGNLYSVINRIIYCVRRKEELTQQWKESIIVTIVKKGDKTDCNNYRGISLL